MKLACGCRSTSTEKAARFYVSIVRFCYDWKYGIITCIFFLSVNSEFILHFRHDMFAMFAFHFQLPEFTHQLSSYPTPNRVEGDCKFNHGWRCDKSLVLSFSFYLLSFPPPLIPPPSFQYRYNSTIDISSSRIPFILIFSLVINGIMLFR